MRLLPRRIAYGFGGRKRHTDTPQSVMRSSRSRSILTEPMASRRTRHDTPAVARSHTASATRLPISPLQ